MVNMKRIIKKKKFVRKADIRNYIPKALVIDSEVQYDSRGNTLYVDDSIDKYLDMFNYFKKRLEESTGIPAKFFNNQVTIEDDGN